MPDWGVYWKWFPRKSEPWPVRSWLIGSGSPLTRAARGDRLWLFTSGAACGMAEGKIGYLLEVLTVDKIGPHDDDHFKFRIVGDKDCCVAIDPPILIDALVRPKGWDRSRSIGSLRQSPWKFPDNTAYELQSLLREKNEAAFDALFPTG